MYLVGWGRWKSWTAVCTWVCNPGWKMLRWVCYSRPDWLLKQSRQKTCLFTWDSCQLCSWCRGWTQCSCLANCTHGLKMFTTVLFTRTLNSPGRKYGIAVSCVAGAGAEHNPCLANSTRDLKVYTTVLCARYILGWRTIRQVCCRLGPSWPPPATTPYACGILSPRWLKLQATNATSTAVWVLLYFNSYQIEVVFSAVWRVWSGFIL